MYHGVRHSFSEGLDLRSLYLPVYIQYIYIYIYIYIYMLRIYINLLKMKYRIQFLKIKCSQTTRRVTRSDMKDSSIKLRMTALQQQARTPKKKRRGKDHSAGFRTQSARSGECGWRSPQSQLPPCLSSSGMGPRDHSEKELHIMN